jgi:DNA invertase Pin-like site-specific DNA recombinase
MICAAYIRVSTEDQAAEDAYGLDAQKESIERYCANNSIELGKTFQDTSSGALAERPGLIALMAMAKAGTISKVIVPKLDRLSRDTCYCLWIEKELRKLGVELVSIAEPYRWDDPVQKVPLTLMAAFAEYERELIKLRMSGGRKAKARKGGYAGGRPCMGYKAEKIDRKLVLDEAQAEVVKRVFEIRDERPKLYLREIAVRLNQQGFRSAEGKYFHPVQVKRILDRRSFYEGLYRYSGMEADGQHAHII